MIYLVLIGAGIIVLIIKIATKKFFGESKMDILEWHAYLGIIKKEIKIRGKRNLFDDGCPVDGPRCLYLMSLIHRYRKGERTIELENLITTAATGQRINPDEKMALKELDKEFPGIYLEER